MLGSWKTSIAGLAGGALTAIAGGMDWKHVLAGIAIAIIGAVSKDHDVTGGTR